MVGWHTQYVLEEAIVALLDANPTRLYSGIDVARALGKERQYQTVLAVLKSMTRNHNYGINRNKITRGHDDTRCGNQHTFHSNSRAAYLRQEERAKREAEQAKPQHVERLRELNAEVNRYHDLLMGKGWDIKPYWSEGVGSPRWILIGTSQDQHGYDVIHCFAGYYGSAEHAMSELLSEILSKSLPDVPKRQSNAA